MASDKSINDFIRNRVRQLRKQKRITVRGLADRLGIPPSSYSSMECGFYGFSLDHLYKVLDVLDADISEVWPCAQEEEIAHPAYLKRIQQFRLSEVVRLAGAEGGALFLLEGDKCKTLMRESLSDFLIDRLVIHLEDGRAYPKGLWFAKQQSGRKYLLFFKANSCPDYVKKLVEHYLIIWSSFFL